MVATEKEAPSLFAISPFAISEKSGHLIDDDEFYLQYLAKKTSKFIYYTSEFSAKRLATKYPVHRSNIKAIPNYIPSGLGHLKFATKLKVARRSRVIFFGYNEVLVLIWCAINIFRFPRLYLVATNNVCSYRFDKYRFTLRVFFLVIRNWLSAIIVHTDFERDLLVNLSVGLGQRIRSKKHHLMIPKGQIIETPERHTITVAFFGPEKHDKPLEPLIELIKADNLGSMLYKLYNVGNSESIKRRFNNTLPSNVKLHNAWMTVDEYQKAFQAADLIFLSHNWRFEGKLSGNLCDCISLGVPFVSDRIEPARSMLKTSGKIGYIYEFTSPDWAPKLLVEINYGSLVSATRSIRELGFLFSRENIYRELDACLEL